MVATSPQVWVDGVPLTSLTSWGDLVITDRWPGGNWEMSWQVPIRGVQRLQQLMAGRLVEARMGSCPRFAGFMTEPNWDTGEMVAQGLVRQGEGVAALDRTDIANALATSIPDLAIDTAIARGRVNWVRRASFNASPIVATDTTDQNNYLTALLDRDTAQRGVGWGVNARRDVYTSAAPTVPEFTVIPSSGSLGVADQAQAGTVVLRYQTTSGTLANAVSGNASPEVLVSIVDAGPVSAEVAQARADAIYAQSQARTGWTNGLTLTADQITTPGGAKVNLSSVSAGAFGAKLMRLNGLRDLRGASASTDIVLGETVWDVADGTVQCNPVGLAARDLSSVVEDAGGVLL